MENILQTADRLFQNRYIISIKKAFTITLPVIILGSIASLVNNIPINIVQAGLSTPVGQVIRAVNGAVWLGSTAVMAILIAWTLGYYLGNTYKLNGTLSALTSVSAYLSICVTTPDGGISLSRLGSSGLFEAILIAILATELYHAFSCLKINISEDMAEEVQQMFAALFPIMLSVFCIALTNGIILMTSGKGIDEWIYTALSFLFSAADGGGLVGTLFLVFGIHIFWFFGIHGGNVMDSIMVSAFGENLIHNIDLYALNHNAFDEQLAIISKGFLDAFVFMGGAGTSLCIIIAVFIIARSRYMRSIAKMGGIFTFFNMNEIVLFGFPVILNPILLIPFAHAAHGDDDFMERDVSWFGCPGCNGGALGNAAFAQRIFGNWRASVGQHPPDDQYYCGHPDLSAIYSFDGQTGNAKGIPEGQRYGSVKRYTEYGG